MAEVDWLFGAKWVAVAVVLWGVLLWTRPRR